MDHDRQASVGQSRLRREDDRLITGRGRYVADVALDDPLHVAFVRSPFPRGGIVSCDLAEARGMPGVADVFDGATVAHLGRLGVNPVIEIIGAPDYPILARDHVRAVGQPVAAVLAVTRAQALDAADAVFVGVEDGGSPDFAGARAAWTAGDVDGALASAAHVVTVSVTHPRLAPSPMETRGVAVDYDAATGRATVWLSTQTPHRARDELTRILDIDTERLRVIAPDVGGAFGMKGSLYPEEVFAVWAALELKRPTRWIATRGEDFLAATHGRGTRSEGELAVAADGRFLALKARIDCPLGHWLPNSAAIPAWNAGRILPGGYGVGAIHITSMATGSGTAPVGIYRGAGRPEAACLMERLADEAAAATGVDPIDIRRMNLAEPSRFPHRSPTGIILDSGTYAEALDLLRDQSGYDDLRAECQRRRAAGELVGLGLGFYIEPCGTGWESARVTLNGDGSVLVATGGSAQGQGRETAFAQIAADGLGVPEDRITVIHGDTDLCPRGIGALASRSTAIGGSALQLACEEVMTKRRATNEPAVSAEVVYEAPGEAWGYGCYLAMVSIDRDTGIMTVEQARCVDDAGTVVNPMMVKGQVLGGFAQGLGEALMEQVVYDADGQLLTGSFTDYAIPRAADVPELAVATLSTPSPNNALGAKGIGEAGTIGAPAALLNAAVDALRPLGTTDLEMPLTSERLWRAIRDSETRRRT